MKTYPIDDLLKCEIYINSNYIAIKDEFPNPAIIRKEIRTLSNLAIENGITTYEEYAIVYNTAYPIVSNKSTPSLQLVKDNRFKVIDYSELNSGDVIYLFNSYYVVDNVDEQEFNELKYRFITKIDGNN